MPKQWLYQEFTKRLSSAIANMTAITADIEEEGTPSPAQRALANHHWRQNLSVAGCSVWVVSPEASWRAFGSAILSATGVDDHDPGKIRETYAEMLTESISEVARALSAKLDRVVTCEGSGEPVEPPSDLDGQSLTIRLDDRETVKVWVGFSAGLSSLLAPPSKETAVNRGPQGDARITNMDVLLDVELPVSVSFGRAQLPLKDVIKLTTGSIVELNRAVTEAVDIVVNNCVIARGEVVVVEGNFGVRITQVISRQERLQTVY